METRIENIINYQIDNYNIFINLDTQNFEYRGYVIISLDVNKSFNKLVINATNFIIEKILIDNLKIDYTYDSNNIILKKEFINPKYYIKINFKKKINMIPYGFYYQIHNDKPIFCCHSEPEFTRSFIPCIDIPYLKSTFNLSVLYDNVDLICLFNTEIFNQKKINNKIFTKFKSSPKMSTYLLNLVIGNFVPLLEKSIVSKSGVKINCYSLPESKSKVEWSITHFVKALNLSEEYFQQKYILPNLNYVMIPKYASKATEYWGLIIFKEEIMFTDDYLDKKVSTLDTIYHEVIHQWIGNMVTLRNWNEIWLNESITNLVTWMFLKTNYSKTIEDLDIFYYEQIYSQITLYDCFDNVQPIIENRIYLNEIFNRTIYTKGTVILNYIRKIITGDVFNTILINYFDKYKYFSVDSDSFLNFFCDCYGQISNTKTHGIKNILYSNLKTSGYPLLTIKNTGNKLVILTGKFNPDNMDKNFDISIFLKIKILVENKIVERVIIINKNKITYDLENNSLVCVNTNNELLCVCNYIDFEPNFKSMGVVEILKYLDDLFCLLKYGYIGLDKYIIKTNKIIELEHDNYLIIYWYIKKYFNLLNIFKSFVDIDKLKNKFSFLNKIITQIYLKVENLDDTLYYKYELLDMMNLIELVYFKNLNLSTKLFNSFKNLKYNNSILKSISVNIIKYYPEYTKEIFDIIIKNSNTDYSVGISILQYIEPSGFRVFLNNYIQIVNINNLDYFFTNLVLNPKLANPIIQMFIDNYALINKNFVYEIINGICFNLYNIQLINQMEQVIDKNFASKPNIENNYLLILDYLKSNKKTNSKIIKDFI